MRGGLSNRKSPFTFGVNQSPDSLIALPAAAKRGGVSSTNPVEPIPKRKIIIPKIKTTKEVSSLFLDSIITIWDNFEINILL